MKIRTRRFSGRCAKHKSYNPAVDGREGIKGGCPRCVLLADILESAVKLNGLIRAFDPRFDDAGRRRPTAAAPPDDELQMSLLEALDEKTAPVQ